MNNFISIFKKDTYEVVNALIKNNILNDFNINSISIDYSSKSKQGDLSTNIYLLLQKSNYKKNFDMRNYLTNYFLSLDYVESMEISKFGFINIFLKKCFLISHLKEFVNLSNNKTFFKKTNKRINIEFVSANPTGPIHIAHIRGAVLGDVLSSILESVGNSVTREYYVNDSGSQIKILGQSLFKRYQQLFDVNVEISAEEYPGNYLIDIAKEVKKNDGGKWLLLENINKREKFFENYAVKILIDNIKKDLSLIDINFDKFTYESEIVSKDYIRKVFSLLKEKNLIYEGILDKPLGDDIQDWEPRKQLLFRSSNFSDELDRPFQKANGDWTYFANDSAYHYQKFIRGFDSLINIWGADHIGYISRMKSIVNIFSKKENYLNIFTCQIVRLIKNGNFLKMSKREGNFISLVDIHREVGKDALRYFMVSSKSETPMDFDMNKVIEKNKDNPVFYCQYAFARASSVLRKAKNINSISKIENYFDYFDESAISTYEWELILKILSWPYILHQAAESKQPHRITNYLEDLCSNFHSFWNKGKDDASLRFIDEDNLNKTLSKLIWIDIFKKVLNNAFNIIGIDSPEIM